MRARMIALLLVILPATVLAAPSASAIEGLAGSWRASLTIDPYGKVTSHVGPPIILTFAPDQTFSASMVFFGKRFEFRGTWRMQDGQLTLTYDLTGTSTIAWLRAEGDLLVLRREDGLRTYFSPLKRRSPFLLRTSE